MDSLPFGLVVGWLCAHVGAGINPTPRNVGSLVFFIASVVVTAASFGFHEAAGVVTGILVGAFAFCSLLVILDPKLLVNCKRGRL
jgi:hypothetical protein